MPRLWSGICVGCPIIYADRIVGRLGSLLSLAIAGRHLHLCSPSLTPGLVLCWGGGGYHAVPEWQPPVSCDQKRWLVVACVVSGCS